MISIHALREEGDPGCHDHCERYAEFLSTPSARRATLMCAVLWPSTSNFYPRPPRGGRPISPCSFIDTVYFYPRPPRGGRPGFSGGGFLISRDFYPRPPRGGRLSSSTLKPFCFRFLSTPSARRATAKTETKSLFSNKLYNILHEFRRALIYNGSKNYPNHAK